MSASATTSALQAACSLHPTAIPGAVEKRSTDDLQLHSPCMPSRIQVAFIPDLLQGQSGACSAQGGRISGRHLPLHEAARPQQASASGFVKTRPSGEAGANAHSGCSKRKRKSGSLRPPPYTLLKKNQYILAGVSRTKCDKEDPPSCVCLPPSMGGDGCGELCLNRLTKTECKRSTCPCGEECQNQALQKGRSPSTELKHMGIKGWGLITKEDIPAGSFVVEYVGEVCSTEEMNRRIVKYEQDKLSHTYIMDLSGNAVIDATMKGGLARFINHSCEPNCATSKWQVGAELRVGIFAERDIRAGEELTYSYNLDWNGGKRVRCSCGAPSCLGYLGAHSESFQKALKEDEEDAEQGILWWTAPEGTQYPMDNLDMYDSTSEERAAYEAADEDGATSVQRP